MLLYLSKFWPSPSDPYAVEVHAEIEPAEGRYKLRIEIKLRDGTSQGLATQLDGPEPEAKLAAMFKLTEVLAQLLADQHNRVRELSERKVAR